MEVVAGMRVLDEQTFAAEIGPAAPNAAGDRVLVPVAGREVRVCRVDDGGRLGTERVIALPTEPYDDVENDDAEQDGPRFGYTRASFVGEDLAVVVREIDSIPFNVACIDLRSGAQIADISPEEMYVHVYGPDPLPLGPRHVLAVGIENAVCLEVPSLREAFRIRAFDEEGAPVGEDEHVLGDEQIAANGVAWDRSASTLHVLWSAFNQNSLQGYRIDLEQGAFERAYRRTDVSGDDGVGLCLNPDGSGLTAMVQTMDLLVSFAPGETEAPRLARLGFLQLFAPDGATETARIPLESELRRDFAWGEHHSLAADGKTMTVTGYRFSTDDLCTQPIYVAPRRVVVGTPSGLLLGVDVASGTQEVLHDLGGPLIGLRYHAATRRLVAACRAGRLILLEA